MSTQYTYGGVCELCGAQAPTAKVTFHKFQGMIVMHRHGWCSGHLCRACIDDVFRRYTKSTALAGWWSYGGLMATPVILLWNWIRYSSCSKLPRA